MSKKKNNTNGTEKPTDDKVVNDKPTGNRFVTDAPTNDNQLERLIPLKSWNNYHDWPPVGGMRHIRNKSAKKKASHIFIKKGGLVLVRERAFWEWAATGDAS